MLAFTKQIGTSRSLLECYLRIEWKIGWKVVFVMLLNNPFQIWEFHPASKHTKFKWVVKTIFASGIAIPVICGNLILLQLGIHQLEWT